MQYGFYFDNARCSGCKACELACKDYYDLGPEFSFRRVYAYEGGSWSQTPEGAWDQDVFAYHLSLSCNHCSQPVCVQVCPTGAMHKEDKGLVCVNSHVCVGCGYCMLSCPYKAAFVSTETHVSIKCTGCFERVASGKEPICVEACPVRALHFGDIEALRSAHGETTSIAPMPKPVTLPNIVIRPSLAARPVGDTAGFVANPKEV
ncbi:MAG: dimethylsulfoxide reductase subunit B [Eggerthellaceae bacterium]|jgi:anaerobic dimethyl sulfoxide reductase subunit B (iron-sulfur subunit)|nr:dimethylsulfoxide reductase subunit B [Eggerthellaceae bacterium]MDR2715931.1 dimethylsulfoxide reductase subunit B [Coriobacteriaceae bacterium]